MISQKVGVYQHYDIVRKNGQAYIIGEGEITNKTINENDKILTKIANINTAYPYFEREYLEFCMNYGCIGVSEMRFPPLQHTFSPEPSILIFNEERIDQAANEINYFKKIIYLHENPDQIQLPLEVLEEDKHFRSIFSKNALPDIKEQELKLYSLNLLNKRQNSFHDLFIINEQGETTVQPYSFSLIGIAYWELSNKIKMKERIIKCINCGTYFTSEYPHAKFCDQATSKGKGTFEHKVCENRYNTRKRRARQMHFKAGRSIQDISASMKWPLDEVKEWIETYSPDGKLRNLTSSKKD